MNGLARILYIHYYESRPSNARSLPSLCEADPLGNKPMELRIGKGQSGDGPPCE